MANAFPTEVWRMSWSYASSKDLTALSSSCQLFRDICQPLLFQNLSYLGPFLEEINPTKPQKVVETMKHSRDRLLSISSHPKIPSMVQYWTFHVPTGSLLFEPSAMIYRYPAMKQVFDLTRAISAEFRSSIGVYTNLSRLTITGFQFTPDFCQTITSLPLTSIDLTDCDVDCPVPFGGIALEAFNYAYNGLEWRDDMTEHYNLVSGSELKALELETPVPARVFLTVFVALGPLPQLTYIYVSLGYDAKDVFYRFLDCSPALKCIQMEAPPTFGDAILPETSIPVLHSFAGPIEIAGVFSGGRPVQSFKVHPSFGTHDELAEKEPVDPEVVQQFLLQISTSSATIEDISLPWVSLNSTPLRFIAENFPKLKHLQFFVRDVASEDPQSDEESEEHWETPGGSSVTGDDEIIDVGENDAEHSLDDGMFSSLRKLLSLSGQDLEEARRVYNEHHCDDCASESSDSSQSIDWHEDEAVAHRTYEDIKPESVEHFMAALGNDLIALPRSIQVLSIGLVAKTYSPSSKEESLPDAEISSVVEKLGARYPVLRKVVFGYRPRAWTRKPGGIWKPPKPERPEPSHPMQRLRRFGPFPMA
ncbi:hypothetical protein K438DRAFT_1802511 [Mycena galopus ATCC 62051]|nr:hypothetical protein K438DRAFT_1802511 [Mycena galopus ATCC 62051]